MAYSENPRMIGWEQKMLCLVLALMAAVQLFWSIPAEQVIAEVRDSRCTARQELRMEAAEH